MARFKWDDDREFPFVEGLDFLVPEARWAEKQFGKGLNDLTWSETLIAQALVSLRRNGVMLTIADTEDWTLRFINDRIIPEDGDLPEGEEPDPTEAGPSPAPSSTSGTSGGPSSPKSSDKAPESPSA